MNTDCALVPGEKRQRAAAVQNLAGVRSGPADAKRLGVRQPSGALERGSHPDVAAARQSVQTGTEFRWRLSPAYSGVAATRLYAECRYAETDWSRSPQFAIRNSKWSGLLFRCSVWDGRFWSAPAERERRRRFRVDGKLTDAKGFRACESGVALRLPPQSKTWRVFGAGRRTRSVLECASPLPGRALRNSQFAIRNGQGFFSGFHFGMDDWGI